MEAMKYSINLNFTGDATYLEMPNLWVDDFILNPNETFTDTSQI